MSENPNLKLNSESDGAVEVISIEGRLDTLKSADAERWIFEKFGEKKAYVFDLAKLDYISSSGLRLFLKLARDGRGRNIPLVLCGLNDAVSEVFEISGFSTLLKIAPDRKTAEAELV